MSMIIFFLQYLEKKKEMRQLGRAVKETDDNFAFLMMDDEKQVCDTAGSFC